MILTVNKAITINTRRELSTNFQQHLRDDKFLIFNKGLTFRHHKNIVVSNQQLHFQPISFIKHPTFLHSWTSSDTRRKEVKTSKITNQNVQNNKSTQLNSISSPTFDSLTIQSLYHIPFTPPHHAHLTLPF